MEWDLSSNMNGNCKKTLSKRWVTLSQKWYEVEFQQKSITEGNTMNESRVDQNFGYTITMTILLQDIWGNGGNYLQLKLASRVGRGALLPTHVTHQQRKIAMKESVTTGRSLIYMEKTLLPTSARWHLPLGTYVRCKNRANFHYIDVNTCTETNCRHHQTSGGPFVCERWTQRKVFARSTTCRIREVYKHD